MTIEIMKALPEEKLDLLIRGILLDKHEGNIPYEFEDVTDEDLVEYYGDDDFQEKDIDALWLGI